MNTTYYEKVIFADVLAVMHRQKGSVWFLPCIFICVLLVNSSLIANAVHEDGPDGSRSVASLGNDDASDVYDHKKILNIDIRMSEDDWAATRIAHRIPDWQRITEDPYKYVKADVEIDGVEFKSVGVRKKGFFGSVVSTRPSLKIRFDEFEKDQSFHGLDQLTLNNNVQDVSNLHQFMAYWLFQKSGAITPRCNFAVVSVNGESLGVYANLESIRDPFLERVFDNSKGSLFEGYAGDFRKVELSRIVSKGKNPQSGRKALEGFLDVLTDPGAGLTEIEQQLDVDSFIKFWASEVLMGHWDGYSGNRNNYYLYRDADSNKFYFIPWGADSIFWDPGPFIQQPVPKSVKAIGVICNRLWGIPEIRVRYRREMKRLLDEVWVEAEMLAEIKRVQKMLGKNVEWKNPIVKFRVDAITDFIKGRRSDIETELDVAAQKWPDINSITTAKPNPGSVEITGTFTTKMLKNRPANPFGKGVATIQLKTNDQEATEPYSRFGCYVLPEQLGFIRPGYPLISIVAQDDTKKKMLALSFFIDPIRMAKEKPDLSVDLYCVWATIINGNPQDPKSERKLFDVQGKLKLDQFGAKPGSVVSGSFELKTSAFRK